MRPTFLRYLTTLVVVAAVFTGVTGPAEAAKKRTVRVTTPTQLFAQFHDVEVGEKVRVHGRTTKRTRRVLIQQKTGGKWKTVKRIKSRKGRFATKVKPPRGKTKFRAVTKRRVIHKPRVKRVLVRRASAPVTIRATVPEPPVEWVDAPSSELTLAAWHVRTKTNAHRTSIGVPKMMQNACLQDFAMAHSRVMAQTGQFEHSSDPSWDANGNGVGSFRDVCETEASPWRGEALALVYAETPAEAGQAALDGWLASPPHKSIIEATLNEPDDPDPVPALGDEVGIGVARTSDGFWWVTLVIAMG